MAGIQTSKITTNAADDLVLDPASGKEVQVKSVDASNPGETPVSVNAEGTVKRLNVATLTELSDPDANDFLIIQAGSVRDDDTAGTTVVGNLYKIDGENLGGGKPADPDPGDIVASPGFLGGDGSASDPYVITPATVSAPGGSAFSAQSITILNQKTFVPVPFTDLTQGADNRFAQPGGVTDATGTYRFNLVYNDQPNTTLGDGQIYNGSIKVGSSSVYFKWDVTQIANLTQFGPTPAPNASPTTVAYAADNKYGTVTATWRDGAETLNASNMVFSVNGGAMDGSTKSVADGDTIAIGFIDSQVLAASDGDTIEGEITGSVYYSKFSMVKDTEPAPFTIQPRTDQSASAETTTGNEPILGINAPTTISAAGSSANQLTNTKVSINGATAVTSGTFNPGDSLQGYGTTGASGDTTYQATFTVGGVTATWDVTTSAATADPKIGQPIITSPANGSVDLVPDVVLTGSAYDPQNGAGAHSASTWEVYEAEAGVSVSPSISTTDGESPLTLSGPAPAGLRDKVVMVDSTSPTVVGGETQPTPYTLTTSTITNVAKDEQGIPDSWVYPDNKLSNRDGQQLRAWLDAKGITHVTGFRLKILPTTESEGGLSTEIYEFNINGSELKGSGITPITATGTYFLNADPASWLAGTGTGVVQGESTTLSSVEFTFAPQDVRTGAVYTALRGTRDSVYLFDQNGDPHLLLGMPETGLTFASPNPDLKYFRPGDVIRSLNGPWNGSTSWSSTCVTENNAGNPISVGEMERMFDSDLTNTSRGVYDLTIDNIGLTGVRAISLKATGSAQGWNFWINDVYIGQQQIEGGIKTVEQEVTGGTLNKLRFQAAISNVDMYWLRAEMLDDQSLYFMDPGNSSPDPTYYSVISTDVPGNKMTVDGGTWGNPPAEGEVWSDFCESSTGTVKSFKNFFDASGGTFMEASSQAQHKFLWSPPNPIQINQKLGFSGKRNKNYDGNWAIIVNKGLPTEEKLGDFYVSTNEKFEEFNYVGVLYNLAMECQNSGTGLFNYWRIDGSNVIDNGALPAPSGPDEVKLEITGEGTVAATSGSNVTLSNVEGRWIGSGSENKAGKTFYAATVAQTGAPGAPSDPVDTGKYTAITPSATTLTTATLDATNLDPDKFYYSRVKYGDGSIESDFSEYNEFGTAESFIPEVGEEFGGGYFAGQINDGGTIYNLIVAPIEENGTGLQGQKGGIAGLTNFNSVKIAWKTENSDDYLATNLNYGGDQTYSYINNSKHLAIPWFKDAVGPNAGTYDRTGNTNGTGIGGFNDWYLPAKNELEVCYYYLKPTIATSDSNSGVNDAAVAPQPVGTKYGSQPNGGPSQTDSIKFRAGGSEAFESTFNGGGLYHTSTQADSGKVWSGYFNDGRQNASSKTGTNALIRAIRRQPA